MESSSARSSQIAARLLAGCDPQQREAITSEARPLCVLAAAGSGKTRVLTRRIAWRVNEGSASASYVLALTFTRKAAAELRGRLSGLGLPEPATAGTFHAIALAELRRLAAERGRPAPVVVASKGRLLASAAGHDVAHDRAVLADLAFEIEWAQAQCLSPRDYRAGSALFWTGEPVRARASSPRSGGVTSARSGGAAWWTSTTFCSGARVSSRTTSISPPLPRWRFRHVFVDEYQDVNPAQVSLLEAWLGPNDDLCVVGDPDQAIYAWNGSDPRALVDFPLRHPGVPRHPPGHELPLGRGRPGRRVVGPRGRHDIGPAAFARGASRPMPNESPGHGLVSAGQRPSVTAHPVVAYETDADEALGVVASLRRARARARRGPVWPSSRGRTPSSCSSSASLRPRASPIGAEVAGRFLPALRYGGLWTV